jgi:hypothetical protein
MPNQAQLVAVLGALGSTNNRGGKTVTRCGGWWPQVYLEVTTVTPAGQHGLGTVVDLHTRGKLPYTLRWRARVSETGYPKGFTIEATGDFLGRGIWSIEQDGEWVSITFDDEVGIVVALLGAPTKLFCPIEQRSDAGNNERPKERKFQRSSIIEMKNRSSSLITLCADCLFADRGSEFLLALEMPVS